MKEAKFGKPGLEDGDCFGELISSGLVENLGYALAHWRRSYGYLDISISARAFPLQSSRLWPRRVFAAEYRAAESTSLGISTLLTTETGWLTAVFAFDL